ncbi:hypothetical protein H2199_005415 [Coniosporium tulheliwenetii]|uniref:Uncharacterized protein n=1 Tax=Coniosporium tulheliwenetii TaxID=3383036 RepID=A0ACC2Z259_9PEZI|nr:hypothetical protein H2199_005415 [Cladosporium sp. JES 115]
MATGVSYLGILFVNPIALRYPHFQRHITVLGWSMCILGLIGASFATQVWHLILFQGVFYGVGWVVCYTPFLILLNQWFDKKRGLAYGILFGASGISGLFLPFLLEALLHRFGFRTTLRAFAVATALCSGPGLLMIKPRIPPAMISRKPGRNNHAFLRNPLVYVFAASILLQGLAFFLPNIFLLLRPRPQPPSSSGDLLLAITSLAQVTCQIALGHFSDKASIHLPSHACALISGLAVLLLWGPARDFGRLAAFAALWGATAGSYSVLWTRVAAVLAPGPEETQTLYGWFSFERGVANVLCGPIAAVLLGEEVDAARYGLGRYAGVVGFTGVFVGEFVGGGGVVVG